MICAASALLVQFSLCVATAQVDTGDSSQLIFALVLTRHSVRSPTGSVDKLRKYRQTTGRNGKFHLDI